MVGVKRYRKKVFKLNLANVFDNNLNNYLCNQRFSCQCGKVHTTRLQHVEIGRNAILRLPDFVKRLEISAPVIVADQTTWRVAGQQAEALLHENGVSTSHLILANAHPEADEYWMDQLRSGCDRNYDGIIAIGSGTINDLCKLLAKEDGAPLLVVATAPSMDGYASNTASVLVGGLKTSLPAVAPNIVIADTELLSNAPRRMIQAGFGDMLAKYVSICEWRISNLVTGEYYCATIADLIRRSLQKCMDSTKFYKDKPERMLHAMTEGLILSGVATSFAGISRPASGMEHYFSHVWDMMAIQNGSECDLHGVQVGVATLLTLEVYESIRNLQPDSEQAVHAPRRDSEADWECRLRRLLGPGANGIIEDFRSNRIEVAARNRQRTETVLTHWEEILAIIEDELPRREEILAFMKWIRAPTSPEEINIPENVVKDSFLVTKDIRDKYIASTLLDNLGYLDDVALQLFSR